MRPQPMDMEYTIQELRAQTQQTRQNARRAFHHARLAGLMPGANGLTRAITAAILDARGLLDEPPGLEVHRKHAAILFAQAGTLRLETERVCGEAIALCREAKSLCKERPAPVSWRLAPEEGS